MDAWTAYGWMQGRLRTDVCDDILYDLFFLAWFVGLLERWMLR
jgi:hypothetical protein